MPTGNVDLASGDPIQVSLVYDGSNYLVESLKDLTTSSTYSTTYTVGSLATVTGGSMAYVGFTGATGGATSIQTISNFSFVLGNPQCSNLLPITTPLTVAASATLDLGGVSQQVASLDGGGILINSDTGTASILTLSPTSGSNSFSGMIQGGGTLGTISLMMSGSGTQVLCGSNSYTGSTTIIQGKLVVDGWLANSAVSVNGGTLGGTGNLNSVTVYSGGNLAPGDSLGTLSVNGSLILEEGAVLDYVLDKPATSGEIYAGTLALNNQQFSDFNFTWSANFGPGSYDLIDFVSSSGSLGTSTSGTIDGYPASLAVQGNDLILNVAVPEPSTATLLATGVLGLVGWAWRRRLRQGQDSRT